MSEFYTIAWHTARKVYRCEECRADIKVGDRYCRHAGKQEGYMFDATVCARCQGMRHAAWEVLGDSWGEGPTFGELRMAITEETGENADVWYDRWLAERKVQADLRALLGEAVTAYQVGAPQPPKDNPDV